MNETNHPEQHINEEPSNDFMDVGIGFGAMFGFMFLVATIVTIITLFK
jgi:hypothetical protein